MLRRNWRFVSGWILTWVSFATVLAIAPGGHPQLRGALLGMVGTIAVGGTIIGLSLLDGTFLVRIGRSVEEQVGDELRRVRGVYGVISGLPFETHDVDHVVLTPNGVYAVEVKYLFGERPRDLQRTHRLVEALRQSLDNAARTRRLLRSRGQTHHVHPLLVLAGPGAPDLDGQVVDHEGVRIVALRDFDRCRDGAVGNGPDQLDLSGARDVAGILVQFQHARWAYNERNAAEAAGV